MSSIFEQDLPRTQANFAPLSPLSFLQRAAEVYPQKLAIVHGTLGRTWGEAYAGPDASARAGARSAHPTA